MVKSGPVSSETHPPNRLFIRINAPPFDATLSIRGMDGGCVSDVQL